MQTQNPKWFFRFGIIFFITATAYFAMLLWKAWLWALWIKQLENRLLQQSPPTNGPLIHPNEKYPLL